MSRRTSAPRCALFVFCLLSVTTAGQQAKVFTTGTPEELVVARTKATPYVQTIAERHGVGEMDLVISRVWVDQLSMAHVRLQQHFRNIPVFGAEAVVHLRADGELFGDTDDLLSAIRVDIRPTISTAEALQIAKVKSGCEDCIPVRPEPVLRIYRLGGVDHLVYEVQFRQRGSIIGQNAPVVFIDAHTGDVVYTYDNLQTAQ